MDRGMKKWAPFKALEEQETYLNAVFKKHLQEEEKELMDDAINQINDILSNYYDEKVQITYFHNETKIVNGYIDKIDSNNKTLKINNILIPLDKIKNIQII